jgi:septal ring factor EnvC (AmiA/AmiB activator)
LRVGNILVGDSKSFEKYFPSEGSVANRLFVGEIHIISENVIPNSQRNDFETNEAYNEMFSYLQEWARKLNKNYRRGTSELNRAIVENEELDKKQEELEKKVKTQITSETKREYLINETEKLKRKRRSNEKKLQKALKNNIISDDKKKDNVEKILEDSTKRREETEKIKNEISHADYSTKKDLPSSYSKAERKVYERIIGVIDKFFNKDEKTAEALRNAIVEELQVKKKR